VTWVSVLGGWVMVPSMTRPGGVEAGITSMVLNLPIQPQTLPEQWAQKAANKHTLSPHVCPLTLAAQHWPGESFLPGRPLSLSTETLGNLNRENPTLALTPSACCGLVL
jgi:hypothetical protein